MEPIYIITRFNFDTLTYEAVVKDLNILEFYYAYVDKEILINRIKDNWTDLCEGVYKYIGLITMDLAAITPITEPILIFEYQKDSRKYIEYAVFRTFEGKLEFLYVLFQTT